MRRREFLAATTLIVPGFATAADWGVFGNPSPAVEPKRFERRRLPTSDLIILHSRAHNGGPARPTWHYYGGGSLYDHLRRVHGYSHDQLTRLVELIARMKALWENITPNAGWWNEAQDVVDEICELAADDFDKGIENDHDTFAHTRIA